MNKARMILFAILLGCSSISLGQDTCANITSIMIDTIAEGNEKLAFPLYWTFGDDTIGVYPTHVKRFRITAFKILGKKCEWQIGFLKGQTSYRIRLTDKEMYGNIVILFNSLGKRYIELTYDNEEKQSFYVSKVDYLN